MYEMSIGENWDQRYFCLNDYADTDPKIPFLTSNVTNAPHNYARGLCFVAALLIVSILMWILDLFMIFLVRLMLWCWSVEGKSANLVSFVTGKSLEKVRLSQFGNLLVWWKSARQTGNGAELAFRQASLDLRGQSCTGRNDESTNAWPSRSWTLPNRPSGNLETRAIGLVSALLMLM